jgi:hypothetical protein
MPGVLSLGFGNGSTARPENNLLREEGIFKVENSKRLIQIGLKTTTDGCRNNNLSIFSLFFGNL